VLLPEGLVHGGPRTFRLAPVAFLRENAPFVPATRAIFLDALGTIVDLEPPWVHLGEALGVEPDERMVRAVRTEMGYYKEHSHEGRDPASLAELRGRCAELLSRELGREVSVETMMETIRFRAFPDAAPALAELRELGLRLVCVSNWDCSLGEVLDRVGLGAAVDGVVTSAGAGARKPDPAIFAPALELAGCGAEEALHVGDTAEEDVAAANAAGIRVVLLDREGGGDNDTLGDVRRHVAS
jgi:putative hydrolase of the HAD superfamily